MARQRSPGEARRRPAARRPGGRTPRRRRLAASRQPASNRARAGRPSTSTAAAPGRAAGRPRSKRCTRHSTLTNVPSFSAWCGDRQGHVRGLGERRVGPAEDDQELRPAQPLDRLRVVGALAEVAVADHQHAAPAAPSPLQQVLARQRPTVAGGARPASSAPRRLGAAHGPRSPPLRLGIVQPARGRRAPGGAASRRSRPAWRTGRPPRGEEPGAEEGDRARPLSSRDRRWTASSASFQPVERRDRGCAVAVAGGGRARAAGSRGSRLVALEGRAAVVAHPVVVDLGVEARLVALDLAAPVLDGDVAPHLAAGAERRLLVEVPDALGEAEAGRGQGAHRADVDHAGGEVVVAAPCPGRCRSRRARRG